MNGKRDSSEENLRNEDNNKRQENLYYIEKWGVTEKQFEEAVEQTNSGTEEELLSYLTNHGYVS